MFPDMFLYSYSIYNLTLYSSIFFFQYMNVTKKPPLHFLAHILRLFMCCIMVWISSCIIREDLPRMQKMNISKYLMWSAMDLIRHYLLHSPQIILLQSNKFLGTNANQLKWPSAGNRLYVYWPFISYWCINSRKK